ncbi:MAG TPA: hypothetical protein VHU16_02830 [Candidatus Udaeobacter sp.]|nr:hypothetical protein [Candidatus Udaeobacter sp.]
MSVEVAVRFLGSTGCQSATGRIRRGEPVVHGSLPQTGLFLHGVGYIVAQTAFSWQPNATG